MASDGMRLKLRLINTLQIHTKLVLIGRKCRCVGTYMRLTMIEKHKRSRRQAIAEYCKECSYDPEDKGAGTWRQQIEACVMSDCPLYEFRPLPRTNSPTLPSGVVKNDTPQDLPDEAMVGLGVHQPQP